MKTGRPAAGAPEESREDMGGTGNRQECADALEDEIAQHEAMWIRMGREGKEVKDSGICAGQDFMDTGDVIRKQRDVMDYIDNWEPDDEDDELDEASLWEPVERRWSGYGMLSLELSSG